MGETKTELQRLLSKRGFCSRKQAAELIKSGRVKVNNKIVKNPLAYISLNAEIDIDDASVKKDLSETILIAFNKPKGVVTTTSDEKDRKTVYDILPVKYRSLKAVGRLDMATTGLLLFTNDNKLADYLLDPKNHIPRTYVVTVKGMFSEKSADLLREGIKIENEKYKASDLEIKKTSRRESMLLITLDEGKNREIRNMCKHLGHEVIKLKRISFGDIELGNLSPGETRVVTTMFF